ncbi:TolC family protein [Marinifilum sp. D737]|uniref:TolC family protein n=1 Tax=Marinifilum sp. D737 TaxID=2969628 RepID=UPI00227659CF|nr:TolC family protein [Marinifilum sp. D737]MCY1635194.1 TolC family protein [Marinifilum sp. D737]
MIKKISLSLLFNLLLLSLVAQEELSLSQAIQVGLENNYELKIIRKSEQISELNNSWGNVDRYPRIQFNLQGRGIKDYNDTNDFTRLSVIPSLDLNWTLFEGFAVQIRKDKFDDLEQLSKGNTLIAIENRIELIILAYYKILLEQERLKVSEKIMKLSSDRYEKSKIGKELGSAVTYDVLQSKNAWLEDRSSYLLQEVNFNNAVRDLNFLLGVKESKIYKFSDEFLPVSDEYQLASLLDEMLGNNSNLKNRYMQEMILRRDVELARSNFYPKLNFGAGVQGNRIRTKPDGMSSGTTDSHNLYANLSLSYMIFNGNSNRRALQIAKIQEEIGKIETEDLKHTLTNALAQNYELYQVRRELYLLAEENLEAAELNLSISKDKYESGSINSFNYRDVQIGYQNVALSRLNAIFNLIQSRTSLVRLTGGILNE